ncbi:MAG TPA: hypothetical protein DCZ97_01650 [Syntrophus sp. (in: bacteria)]|nr:hypothetical protein [Syntrophus sp. (in: bacteria)]
MTEIPTTQADRLRQLHGEIMGAARMVMEKAIEAGGILHEVKAALPHGDFTAWIETNTGFNIRTAQRYMKIYDNRDQLKNDSVSLLTDAHKLLTAPKEECLSDEEQNKFERTEGIIEAVLPTPQGDRLSSATIKRDCQLADAVEKVQPYVPDILGYNTMRGMLVAEQKKPSPPPQPQIPTDAILSARMAIELLLLIGADDPRRDEGLRTVKNWIRKNATRSKPKIKARKSKIPKKRRKPVGDWFKNQTPLELTPGDEMGSNQRVGAG